MEVRCPLIRVCPLLGVHKTRAAFSTNSTPPHLTVLYHGDIFEKLVLSLNDLIGFIYTKYVDFYPKKLVFGKYGEKNMKNKTGL